MTLREAKNLKPGDCIVDLEDFNDIMVVIDYEEGECRLRQVIDYHAWAAGSVHRFEPSNIAKLYRILTEEEKARLI